MHERRARLDRALAGTALALALVPAACGPREAPPRELRAAFSYGIPSLDPHADRTFASFEQLSNVYEPLTVLDAELRARPALALSWDNPDPLTWVFRLRPDVVFHDGSPFTAEDVVHSYTRLRDDASLKMRSYVSSVADVTARGASTVVLRTRWPNAQLLSSLSFVPIVPRGATAQSLAARPNGTGPWSVSAWEPPTRLRLARHERYWGTRPPAAAVSVQLGLTTAGALDAVDSGGYDVIRFAIPEVEKRAIASGTYSVLRVPNLYLRHLGYDMARETTPFVPGIPNPFRKRPVRQALQLALDLPRLAARVDPQAAPAEQLVPRAVFGYEPGLPLPRRDLAAARRLMAEAGLASGFDVTLHRSGFSAAANELKAQLAEIGVRVTPVEMPSADFFAALSRHELSFWIVANGCPSGDATELLWSSFHSPDAARGAGLDNHAGYVNADVDRGMEEADRLFEPGVRLPVLQRSLRAVLSDLVWIPLYYSSDVFIVNRQLTLAPRADGLLRYADLKPAAR